MRAGSRITLLILILCSLFPAPGCGHHHLNQELLEAENRTKEIQYRELLEEHDQLEHDNLALQRELAALRQGHKILPEQGAATFTVKRITLGRMTGGINTNDLAGDDALQVAVEPRDGADHVLKAPGTLHVLALEIQPQGIKTPLCTWDLGPDELGKFWKSGLFSNGYVLTLPWKSWPNSENLRVVARLVLADGRVFEADKDVRVRLPAGRPRITPDSEPPLQAPEPRPFFPEQGKATIPLPAAPAGTWQAAPLGDALKLQQPVPFDP